jgi:hypothetical protein
MPRHPPGHDNALGIQPGQQVPEAAALLADAVLIRDEQVVDEQHVGGDRVAAELGDRLDPDVIRVHGRKEQGHAVGGLGARRPGRGAGDQQQPLGLLGPRDEDLLAVDPVAAGDLFGERGDAGGIGAGIRLGDAAASVHPLTALWERIRDLDGLERFSVDSRKVGFRGKIVLHPTHVPVVNQAYTPSPADVDFYRGLLKAYEDAAARGEGAVMYGDIHIDKAHADKARDWLRRVDALADLRGGL